MATALVEGMIAARLAIRALGQRLRGATDPEPNSAAFETDFERALAALPDGAVRRHHWLTLPASEPPWRDTGVSVTPESDVSYFAVGRVHASRALGIWVTPKNQIWARIGESGHVLSSSRDSNSFSRQNPGRLFLGNYFPNDWKNRQGDRLQDDAIYASVTGETRICVVEWGTPLREGLEALVRAGDPMGLASRELERVEGAARPPHGWSHLWHIGENEIFQGEQGANGDESITCHVEGDVGILQKDVDVPLTPDSEISWNWIIDSLPGVVREDTLPSHDYLSIAVEFDNGWDITYYWSAELEKETGFVCPLPNWRHREYHVVVRSGQDGLGQRFSERRNLVRDTEKFMSSHMKTAPRRIVRVWLIANSVFLRRPGRGHFSNIRITSEGRDVKVL